MKAAYYQGDGKFNVVDGEKKTPAEGEVRLNIAYCGVCGTDIHIYHGAMDQRIPTPMVTGHEASAEVAEVGKGVDNIQVGDRVALRPLKFGDSHPYDKGHSHIGKNLQFIGIDRPGAFQSSMIVPAYTLHKIPDELSLKYAALIEPLSVACHDVRRGKVEEGELCIVLGGGPIGLLIAYVLREKGAEVVVSEVNQARIALIEELGFTVVNPTREDIEETVAEISGQGMADVVFEVSGSAAAVQTMTKLTGARGRIVMVAIHSEPREVDLFQFFWAEIEMIGARLYTAEDYEEAIQIASSGNIPFEKIITDVQPLANIQQVFEEIDRTPGGIKYLIDCRAKQ